MQVCGSQPSKNSINAIKTENPNEYVRRDWTIRINGDIIEAFNDPDKNKGLYYSGPVKLVDLEQLLIEIDEFIKL